MDKTIVIRQDASGKYQPFVEDKQVAGELVGVWTAKLIAKPEADITINEKSWHLAMQHITVPPIIITESSSGTQIGVFNSRIIGPNGDLQLGNDTFFLKRSFIHFYTWYLYDNTKEKVLTLKWNIFSKQQRTIIFSKELVDTDPIFLCLLLVFITRVFNPTGK